MGEPATLTVDFVDGVIAVRDHGGSGPTVLLVHALGMCAVNWDRVAPLLTSSCRVLAIDLPGHGRSTATMRTPFSVFECVLEVVRRLDVSPTLLVGHDHGSYIVAEAVTAAPELFSGGVAIGGSIARTNDEMKALCDLAASEFFVDAMRARFRFGATGHGLAAAEKVVEEVVLNASMDWVLQDIDGLRREREYSMRYAEDGSWVHLPDPEDVAMVGRFPSTSPYFPTRDLAAGYRVPVWIVQLSQGYDAHFASRERALAGEHEAVRLVRLRSGQWPQYEVPAKLANLIARIAADPEASRIAGEPTGSDRRGAVR